MHRALATPDVFFEIISYFRAYSNSSDELKSCSPESLRSIALSCKQFTEGALDALWYRMDDLLPLFKLLGSFEFESESPGSVQDAICEATLARFKAYARRIRIYAAEDKHLKRIATSAHLRVIHILGETCLLPRLQDLCVYLPSLHDELLFLLHPGLLRLCIHTNHAIKQSLAAPVNTPLFLQSLPRKCPDIQTLMLFINRTTELQGEVNAFLTVVPQMRQVRHITFEGHLAASFNIPANFFATLSSFATLTSATIGGYSCVGCVPPTISVPSVRCSALTELEISFDITQLPLTSGAQTILGSDSMPVLEALTLRIWCGFPGKPMPESEEIISKWAALCDIVRVVAPHISSLDIDKAICSLPFTIPFTSLLGMVSEHITSISLDGGIIGPLQKTDLLWLLKSAPRLRTLEFFPPWIESGSDSNPQFLIDVATTLTSLTKLQVGRFIGQFPPMTDLPITCNNLQHLTIIVDDDLYDLDNRTVHIASCIHRLFPHLTSFECLGEDDHPRRHSWNTVYEVLRALWDARECEKTRRKAVLVEGTISG